LFRISQAFSKLKLVLPGTALLLFTAASASADVKPLYAYTSIGGTVTYNGSGLAGVTVTLSDCAGFYATTGSTGAYSLYPVLVGSSCTVTPSLSGYTFTPASASFTDITQPQTANFTATLNSGSYTISGTVTLNGSGFGNVRLSGCDSPGSSGSNGAYSITVSYGTNCTLTPTYTGYTFSPSSTSFTDITRNQTGINFTATEITYTISGTVTLNGNGLSGVNLSGCASGATTGSGGGYSITVPYGTSCTLTPTDQGYTFSPASASFSYITSNQTQNFTATPNTYSISGTVTAGGVGLSGVVLSGCASGATSGSNGAYSIAVSSGTGCTLTPSLQGFTFSPSSKSFTNITSNQTQNFTANATVTATLTVTGPQSGSTYYAGDSFTLTVNGPPNQPVEIYETKNGTVVANGPVGGSTNSSGVWTASGAWQLTDADPYSETWSVANIAASALNFTVSQFTISGTVTYNSSGLSGVTMSGCGSGSVATGSNGSYSIPVLAGSSCTLTPSLAGYTFSPASASFSNVTANQTQNFTATAVSLTISGTVTYGGSGLSGVLMSGNCPSQPTTGSNGSYSITVTYGTSCTLAPSMSGYYTFSPASVPFSDITSSKQQNFTAAPVTSIASLSPTSGQVGTSVTIAGNFGPIQGTVTFNGVAATIGSWAANSIGATVPSGATTGPVVVTAGGVASNGVTFTVTLAPVAAPAFSPAAGTYTSAQTVTITCATGGATIRYTTNGATPSENVGTVYSGPVSIGTTATLQAIAYESGMADSSVTSGLYTINLPVAAPTFSPAAGTYTSAQSVTISSGTGGASIRYTTNGATPSENVGTVYSGPVSIGSTTTLQAIAYESGMTDSSVTSALYTINLQVAAPVFSVQAGTYTSAQTVTITCATGGATIRYTTNGATPSENVGTVYSGPVSIGTTATLQAIAYESGMTDSTVTSALYTINLPATVAAPTFSPVAGAYQSAQSVTISSATSGASIRYTINGSTPSETSGALYDGPIVISSTTTINAIAYLTGMTDSAVTSATYAIGTSFTGLSLGSNVDCSQNPCVNSLTGPAQMGFFINGAGFGTPQGNSTVTLNGTPLTVPNWQDAYIFVQVPSTATSGNIVVTVGSQSGIQAGRFTVTNGFGCN
jgi:hypothetical protein